MRPVPVLSDYLVKLVIPASRAILKPAVIYRFVSLVESPSRRKSFFEVFVVLTCHFTIIVSCHLHMPAHAALCERHGLRAPQN